MLLFHSIHQMHYALHQLHHENLYANSNKHLPMIRLFYFLVNNICHFPFLEIVHLYKFYTFLKLLLLLTCSFIFMNEHLNTHPIHANRLLVQNHFLYTHQKEMLDQTYYMCLPKLHLHVILLLS